MKLSPRLQFALLGGALVVIVAFVFLQGGGTAAPAEQPRLTPAGAPPPAPSAENVAPAFHTQLMTLKRRVEEVPRDTAALLQLARLQQDAHDLEDAAASYERLLAIVPDHRQAHLDLALVYAEAGHPEDALRVTEALLARVPDDPAGLYNLGALHANAGRYDEARGPWRRVAAQTQDATLAGQARSSLAQLDALAARGTPTGGAAPAMAAAPAGSPGALPSGHPPLPSLQPIMVER